MTIGRPGQVMVLHFDGGGIRPPAWQDFGANALRRFDRVLPTVASMEHVLPYEASDASAEPTELLLRLPAVMKVTGLGRSTIYRLVAKHQFPSPVHITGRAVAWRRVDLERWSASCPTTTH